MSKRNGIYVKSMLSLLIISITVMVFGAFTLHAQVNAPGGQVPAFNLWTFLTSPTVKSFMITFMSFLAVMLPGIQLILKRIPTPYSVKFTTWFGWFLDVLTFYQKDIIHNTTAKLTLDAGPPAKATAETSGVTTSEPAVGAGPEKTTELQK